MYPCVVITGQPPPFWLFSEASSVGSVPSSCSWAMESPAAQLPTAEAARTPPCSTLLAPSSWLLEFSAAAWRPEWPPLQTKPSVHYQEGWKRLYTTAWWLLCSRPLSAPCFLSSCPPLEGLLTKAGWIASLLKILQKWVSDPCQGGVRKGGVL